MKKRGSRTDSHTSAKKQKRVWNVTVNEVKQGIKDGTYDCQENSDGRSQVWTSFLKVRTADTKEDLDYVSCKKCSKVYVHNLKMGTTSLIAHAVKCKGKTGDGSMEQYLTNKVSKEDKLQMLNALAKYDLNSENQFVKYIPYYCSTFITVKGTALWIPELFKNARVTDSSW